MSANNANPAAIVLGCAGTSLSADEKSFFRDLNPLGLILFQRNCAETEQIRDLIASFRDLVGREDAPVLIDQEGGRVVRLKPPQWPEHPPACVIGALAERDVELACRAAWLNARLIAATLLDLGITVDCAPVVDLSVCGAHDVIGDRAFSASSLLVSMLGRAACEGFMKGGITPVIKHIPGHGRALADSHLELPVIDSDAQVLEDNDFVPFRDLSTNAFGVNFWAMAAHCVYTAFDADNAASVSPRVIKDIIRGEIGFDGVLIADDIGMNALEGSLEDRVRLTLSAGCDLTLHCSGKMEEMSALLGAIPPLGDKAAARLGQAEQARRDAEQVLDDGEDMAALREEFEYLIGLNVAA